MDIILLEYLFLWFIQKIESQKLNFKLEPKKSATYRLNDGYIS